jgi:hypothetical protein
VKICDLIKAGARVNGENFCNLIKATDRGNREYFDLITAGSRVNH